MLEYSERNEGDEAAAWPPAMGQGVSALSPHGRESHIGLTCLMAFMMQLLGGNILRCRGIYLFHDPYPDALTEPFALPVPALVDVPLQPHTSIASSAEQRAPPRKPMAAWAFAIHTA